jgi:uncharacterized membrane protein YgdD (TMEM256/DUF423 family)
MNWPAVGAVLLGLAVATGAFGAHALKTRFDAYAMGIWEKAVFYHFIHAFGLLVVPLIARAGAMSPAAADRVCWLLVTGVLIFSGSLYALAITGVRALLAITPLGGIAFIGAWALLAWSLLRAR